MVDIQCIRSLDQVSPEYCESYADVLMVVEHAVKEGLFAGKLLESCRVAGESQLRFSL